MNIAIEIQQLDIIYAHNNWFLIILWVKFYDILTNFIYLIVEAM